MRLSTRFTLLSFTTATVAGVLLLSSLLYWEFETRKALWVAEMETALATNQGWPLMLHFRNDASILRELSLTANHVEGTAFVVAYHVDGEAVASYPPTLDAAPRLERSKDTRLGVITGSISDFAIPQDSRRWTSVLPGANTLISVSVPVMSPVNPLDVELGFEAYRAKLAADEGTGARFVTGYVEAAITSATLLEAMTGTAGRILAGVATLLLLALLIIRSAARTISKPLEDIARVAHAITEDDIPKGTRLTVRRQDEIGDIATVLNGVIEGVHRIKAKADVDRTLMSMKVDATSKKLNAAEEEVSRTQSQIKRVAYFDSVTGLPNRRLMLEQLAMLMQIAARERRHLGVLLVDLDNLRRINESLGRHAGDQILRETSNRILDTMRHSDVVSRDESPRDISRVGNTEFCILLHGISGMEDAQTAAMRLLQELNKPYALDDQTVNLNFHAGVALAPDHAKRPEDLLRAADVALNHSRNNNMKNAVTYDQSLDEAGSERFQLEMDLRNANFESQMELLYQPQISVETGKIIGAEALIRWHHPTRGTVPPFKFIPIAEESGLIIELGSWILDRACRDLVALKDIGIAIPKISVNVSAVQLTEKFVDEVIDAVARYQIQPNELELELTESLLVQNVDTVMQRLQTLKNEAQVRLSVDDFGTGYSSLAYLSRFPLDELKVDRSFVLAMEEDETAAKVTGAIIAIGRQLDLEVVVEGVETTKQYQRMRELGGSAIQGYLFSPPISRTTLEAFSRTFDVEKVLAENEK